MMLSSGSIGAMPPVASASDSSLPFSSERLIRVSKFVVVATNEVVYGEGDLYQPDHHSSPYDVIASSTGNLLFAAPYVRSITFLSDKYRRLNSASLFCGF